MDQHENNEQRTPSPAQSPVVADDVSPSSCTLQPPASLPGTFFESAVLVDNTPAEATVCYVDNAIRQAVEICGPDALSDSSSSSSSSDKTPRPMPPALVVPCVSTASDDNSSGSVDEYGASVPSVPTSPVCPPPMVHRRNSASGPNPSLSLESLESDVEQAQSQQQQQQQQQVLYFSPAQQPAQQRRSARIQLSGSRSRSRSNSRTRVGDGDGLGGSAPATATTTVVRLSKTSNLMYNEKERRALQDMLVFFICEQPQVMDLLFNSIAKDDLEQFLDSVMNLTFSRSVTLKLVWYFMEMEFVKHSSVGSAEATNTLFRENGVASKLLKCYLQKVGQSFLQELLRPIVVQICVRDQRSSYEIDPDRVDSEDERVHNRELLTAAVEHVLNVITSHAMVVKMPPGIRIIAAFFDKLSRQYCPDTNSDALIGGFLMLRYFNPAIMTPEAFGLLPPGKQCSPKARRNLVLIGKVLQNMSNGVLFSSAKEGYMVGMNPWLELNTPRLQRSYHEIVMAATSCSTNLIIDSDLCPVTAADLQYFHQVLFATSDAVLAAIPTPEGRQQLRQRMEALGTYARKISFATELDASEQAHVRATLTRYKEEPTFVCSFETTRKKSVSNNIFVVGRCRLFLMRRKPKVVSGASIVKAEGHILDLAEVRLSGTRGISFLFRTFDITGETDRPEEILSCVKRAFLSNFSHFPQDTMFRVTAEPPAVVPASLDDASLFYQNETPCGGFVRTYHALCDYYGVPPNDMLCWDIDSLYAGNRVFDMRHLFPDGDDVPEPELVPVLHALRYNTHFKELINGTCRIRSAPATAGLCALLRANATLTSLELPRLGLSVKQIVALVDAMASNPLCAITTLKLCGNDLDDKAAAVLGAYVAARQDSGFGLRVLDLESTMHSPKVSSTFFRAAAGAPNASVGGGGATTGDSQQQQQQPQPSSSSSSSSSSPSSSSITLLNLSNNKIGDASTELIRWLGTAGGVLQRLNLSGTGMAGAKLNSFLLVLSKCCPELRALDVSCLRFSPAEVLTVSQLFLILRKLDQLDLSGSVPSTASFVQFLTLGTPGTLISARLCDHSFGSDHASLRLLHETMPKAQAIKSLDLSNTDLGDDGVFYLAEGLTLNTNVRHLFINGAVFRVDSKRPRAETVRALCKLVCSDCPLETLEMAGGPKATQQLGRAVVPLLQTLIHNTRLTSLDISGHMFGTPGALALARALQLNATLARVVYDQNDIGLQGLTALAYAAQKNSTLEEFPLPIMDIAALLTSEKSADTVRRVRELARTIERSVLTTPS